jgi:uncharacterized membrane protein
MSDVGVETSRFGGDVLHTSPNGEGERRLQEALGIGVRPAARTG